MSRQVNLAKNTLILSIGAFLPKFGAFITLPIMTGCLTKNEFGIFDLIMSVFPMILPIATLNIYSASFRYLIDARGNIAETKSIISNTLIFITVMSALALIPSFFFAPGLLSVRILTCIYMFVSLLNSTAAIFTRGVGNNMDYSLSSIVNAFFRVMFTVIFLWALSAGLPGAVSAHLIATVSSLVFLTFRLRIFSYVDLKLFSTEQIKHLVSYSFPEVMNGLCWWVVGTSDRFIIASFLGVAANAVYAVAHKIPSLLLLANATFHMAWTENASLAMKDKDRSEYYTYMFRGIFDLMAGLLGLIIASTPVLFAILVRGDYSDAYNQMPILFMASFFSIISAFLGGIYTANKNTKGIATTTFMAAICNLTINLALIKFIGIYAASVSTVVSYAVVGAVRMKECRKMVSIRYDKKHVIFVVLFLSLMCALCFVRNIYLDAANIIMSIIFFTALNKNIIITLWKKSSAKLAKFRAK